ncbi:amidase [Pararhizobium sp. YC-54]|uniref:amidase n=1 Tax=Pararhizobium sp. YC-54 TaxID=2986920 RepID=UPI0021F7585A|nr:amidase [Pararhizobium sp. YC-54]MCW0002136.1 amidase [Pararhizobium sp. YC-54]
MNTSFKDITATECLELYKTLQVSPVEIVDDCLDRIDRTNPMFNAFCFVDHERARSDAKASELRWSRGEPMGTLDGVPTTIKDLSLTAGMPTLRGSLAIDPAGPWDVDSPVAANLRNSGAILLGKTATPEFGWKGVTESPQNGVTRNPWNKELTCGGSSGGAAVAAALNLGFLHQASDGGGSIRIPASFTGTFGFKPTFGFVPVWPFSVMTGLAHLGPITRTVEDASLMLDVLTIPDARDGWAGPTYTSADLKSRKSLEGVRVAYSPSMGWGGVSSDVDRVTKSAVAHLIDLGAAVEEIDPGFSNPIEAWSTLWFAGAARIFASLPSDRAHLVDPGFMECVEKGRSVSLMKYQDAQQACYDISAKMAHLHKRFDVMVTPTIPVAPFPVNQNQPHEYAGWVDWTPFTYPFNLTQQPAASLPSGLDDTGLPVGVQIVGARYADAKVLEIAQVLEARIGRLTAPDYITL